MRNDFARQTAVAAQLAVGPRPAGVGERDFMDCQVLSTRKRLEKPPTFSGDVDVNGQPKGMPWSQWSFIFRSYFGASDPTATRLLQQVENDVEDPVVVDSTGMTDVERRLSIQWFGLLSPHAKTTTSTRVPKHIDIIETKTLNIHCFWDGWISGSVGAGRECLLSKRWGSELVLHS